MTKTAYVVMVGSDSPVAIIIPSPDAVFLTRKEANAYAKAKNARATRNEYYVRAAKLAPEKRLGLPIRYVDESEFA